MKKRTSEMHRRPGFTLIELLVVIGIIGVLMSLIGPALVQARARGVSTACKSNLQSIHKFMFMYANDVGNRGWYAPPDKGHNDNPADPHDLWPKYVIRPPGTWNPIIMLCPADTEPHPDKWEHSYFINEHVLKRGIRLGKRAGRSSSDIILMGEKKTEYPDYYMGKRKGDPNDSEFWDRVEQYRHTLRLGSNYLYADGHVAEMLPAMLNTSFDPWDPGEDPSTQPTTPPKP